MVMRHEQLRGVVLGLVSVTLVWGTAFADPGNGHGPPPGKGPKFTPTARATPPSEGGGQNHGGPGKGNCVSACQRTNRDCTKNANGSRKSCYQQTCAPQLAMVEACHGGGDGVTNTFGDGVTDQNGGCDSAAAALTQCLASCRAASTSARQACTTATITCVAACGLPIHTPEPTPTATEGPTP